MMMRTHVLSALAVGLAIFPSVTHKFSFLPIIVLATLLPDIDCAQSYLGRAWFLRPLQWVTKHRGLLHSLTFCFLTTLLFALFLPFIALPFFLGYALHLFADSLTIEGVRLWWPAKIEIRGNIRTGGTIERGLFYTLCVVCVPLLIFLLL